MPGGPKHRHRQTNLQLPPRTCKMTEPLSSSVTVHRSAWLETADVPLTEVRAAAPSRTTAALHSRGRGDGEMSGLTETT